MLEVRFAIFFQNDPLTNFMHIFRKQGFHTYDLPKIYIFCGACHSMSTVKIWGNTISGTPFYKHLNIWRALGAARRYANVAARTTRRDTDFKFDRHVSWDSPNMSPKNCRKLAWPGSCDP